MQTGMRAVPGGCKQTFWFWFVVWFLTVVLGFSLVLLWLEMLTIILQGQLERYEELGVVTTKAVMGHFMTISATRLHGKKAGTLYMKGSIASLKHYFINKESDFQYLNLFERKFI